MQNPIFKNFVKKSPISVMARGTMERILNPEQLDLWFENISEGQYTRNLLFSTVFEIMSQVVTGSQKSIHASYQASKEEIGVSITSVYNKINGLEVGTSAELVRYAAKEVTGVIEKLGGEKESLVAGLRVKLLDGNCIEGSEHRIKELRNLAAGTLPGKSLVVFDPALRIPIDVFPCEDGHAQERSLLGDVLPSVEANDLWIGDRNFCVREFLIGISQRGAFSVIRQHGKLPFETLGPMEEAGRTETGQVFEQSIKIVDKNGKEWKFRRIRLVLKKKIRDGDKEIFIISDLPKRVVSAKKIAELYRNRWTIETAFQELATWLNSEINTLGYPPAALFGFCVALVTYMILSVIKAALSSIYGSVKIDKELSGYYFANEISGIYRGMMIAIPLEEWIVFRQYTQIQFVKILKNLAAEVKLSAFLKHPRGPKKPRRKKKFDPKHPHVSTKKILDTRK